MDRVSDPSTTSDRPPHVTIALGIAMVACVFVVLAAWDRLTGLHSLDTRDSLRPVLAAPALRGSGVTLAQVLATLRVLSMAAAACATAMAVLAFRTLRRDRTARLAMSLLAAPLFVCGLATDGIFSTAAAAAVATLWFGPAREWFSDGLPGQRGGPAPASAAARRRTPEVAPHARAWPPPAPAPPRRPAPGEQPPPWGAAPGSAHPWAPPPTSAYDARATRPGRRPGALLAACLVTWAFCALSAIVMAASLVVLAVDSHAVLDRMHRQDPQLSAGGLSDHGLLVVGWVSGALVVAWSLAALTLAVLAFLGRRAAWLALLGSTAVVAVLGLLGAVGSVLLLVPLVAALAVIVLLVRPEVRAWFSR